MSWPLADAGDPKWAETLIGQTVAVFTGAMIPVLLMLLNERISARRRGEEWFERRYVEDCLDVLYEFFTRWHTLSSLLFRNAREAFGRIDFGDIPHTAMARLNMLAGGASAQNWFNAMHGLRLRGSGADDYQLLVQFQTQSADMAQQILALRNCLLSRRLRSKADAYRFSDSESAKQFRSAAEAMLGKITSHPSVTTYTATNNGAQPASRVLCEHRSTRTGRRRSNGSPTP